MDSQQEWYASIRDEIYGPVPFQTLQHWAAQGSITAEASLSTSPEGPWQAAGNMG